MWAFSPNSDCVELIRGEILEKPSKGELHAACARKLTQLFGVRFAARAVVSVQNPVRLTDSEPEPDLALLAVREDYYATAHPEPCRRAEAPRNSCR